MAYHENYILRVTAGHSYNPKTHQDVHVNSEKPVNISSDHIDAQIHIRIKDYRGLPPKSPSSSPYFYTPQHPYDRYSISFSFTPKSHISGHHLVFGNDFDHPIRDRLPPLFDKAFGIVKWWIDPGLDGDVYGDEPYLYGALLSSINVLRIGSKTPLSPSLSSSSDGDGEDEEADVEVYEEGAEGDGNDVREEHSIPLDARQRQKHFLSEDRRKQFRFEAGREYKCDFFNPYLDFNEFALKLGYGLPAISIVSHWDGQPLRTHSLRYVLKNRESDTELFVIVFQLVPTKEARRKDGVQCPEEQFEMVHGTEGKVGAVGEDDDELD
ncbi:DUF1769-domain-containing protein [Lindgomyces ingoldianus]|uniref:DUF1769-domain-containing protein n=1 Tax=Lindgomyces ingoldianus TaxID=673940 RepID=A0ACB6RD75_9PLEO|nr:DUF1769-domain-containing protein [Lindgomyces ingoldianus]KAF2476680.1 DUF1769-domain-containing protein [Lindgomyces ingoldianus]